MNFASKLVKVLNPSKGTPLWRHASTFTFVPEAPPVSGETKKLNFFQALTDAMDIAMSSDQSALVFGEDVHFGGVFRCTMGLADKYGKDRCFNTPLCLSLIHI